MNPQLSAKILQVYFYYLPVFYFIMFIDHNYSNCIVLATSCNFLTAFIFNTKQHNSVQNLRRMHIR